MQNILCSMVLSHSLPRMTVRSYDGIMVNVLMLTWPQYMSESSYHVFQVR